MALIELLDLESRVAAAEHLIAAWDLHHPKSARLTSSAEILSALHAGSPGENDPLLLRLAEPASVDGGASVAAAAVLAKQVLPGVAARLRGAVSVAVASGVGGACGGGVVDRVPHVPVPARHWVATTISWQVHRATFHELGDRGDGATWASTTSTGRLTDPDGTFTASLVGPGEGSWLRHCGTGRAR